MFKNYFVLVRRAKYSDFIFSFCSAVSLFGRPVCFLGRRASKPFSSSAFIQEIRGLVVSPQEWLREEVLAPLRPVLLV